VNHAIRQATVQRDRQREGVSGYDVYMRSAIMLLFSSHIPKREGAIERPASTGGDE
jgi:hypothetical protein